MNPRSVFTVVQFDYDPTTEVVLQNLVDQTNADAKSIPCPHCKQATTTLVVERVGDKLNVPIHACCDPMSKKVAAAVSALKSEGTT